MNTKFRAHIFAILMITLCLPVTQGCDGFLSRESWPTGEYRESFPHDQLNFLVLGDWGRKGNEIQTDVAKQMGIDAHRDNSQFIISTGDNFYNDGVLSLSDDHWERSFEKVYTSPSLDIPWYISLGNHDHKGDTQAQVDYTSKSDRWTLPSPYYTRHLLIDDSTTALIVFIDPTPIREDVIDAAKIQGATGGAALQLKWLDETLAASDATWRIVVGHHPLFSVGEAHRNSDSMISNLQQVLEEHKVHVYFSGHAHSLQHLKPEGSVHYFVSGSGSHVRRVRPDPKTIAAKSVPGFLAVSLTSTQLTVQFVDFKGDMHHEVHIYP